MNTKLLLKNTAIRLRERGYSFKEISRTLGISKSTASLWLRNVEVTAAGKLRLSTVSRRGTQLGLKSIQRRWRLLKETREKESLENAKATLSTLSIDRDYCKLLASLIFWCEGGKRHNSEMRFINSDPLLVQIFLYLLRQGFELRESKLRVNLHLHEYHDEVKQRLFWSKVTGIPVKQFYKSYQKPHTGHRIRKDYPGCATIRYADNSKTLSEIKATYNLFAKRLIDRGVV